MRGEPGGEKSALLNALSSPAVIAVLVLIFGLGATIFAWRTVEIREDRLISERFENVAAQLMSHVERHQRVHEQSLRAGAALVSIINEKNGVELNAAKWRAIYDNLRVAELLPGVQGFGFAEAVTAGNRAEHIARIRQQGYSQYDIRPAGERDFSTPIVYLEPLDSRNQQAHGFDMFSEPERRAVMTRAAETGATAATGRVRLVQESGADLQSGFLLYVPVYRSVGETNSDGVKGALEDLAGFVYSPVRAADFFNAILRQFWPTITQLATIDVFDGAVTTPESLIFETGNRSAGVRNFALQRSHDLFGQTWTVRMSPLPAFVESVDRRARREILIGGLVLSLMAGALAWLVVQRQQQREEAAMRNDMVAREMSHRVKNLLAVIQSIASRTMSGGRTLQDARAIFSDRLSALARAHSALVDGQWSGAPLRGLLEGELAPFGARVSVSGPYVRLNAQMAQNMAMAVHELATNAVKYGALSDNAGIVRIVWRIRQESSGPVFSFSWVETGGPTVVEPQRDGFGQTLLRRLVGSTIGSDPVVEYAPQGFRYSFECPLDRIVGTPAAEAKSA
ncbi:MAG: CHASE domain-containing protein [Beijerinckiaceae bacterium]|nr:CHASE domain-containing protein [Beijerinckiaceae bacterium]